MRQKKTVPGKPPAEDIRRATRRHFSAEEKIRIVLEGLRGEESIAELCRREGIATSMYYGWSNEFRNRPVGARSSGGRSLCSRFELRSLTTSITTSIASGCLLVSGGSLERFPIPWQKL